MNYYRVMLGRGGEFAEFARAGGFIGVNWLKDVDLSKKLAGDRRTFSGEMIPKLMADEPGKTRMSAALASGFTYTVSKGISIGDIVLCPNGSGEYLVGKVSSGYSFHEGENLPHRRLVAWYPKTIARNSMSRALRNSTGAIGTISNITQHAAEIETLLSGVGSIQIITSLDETIEDPTVFALEKYLEEFLVSNWSHTVLGQNFDIYEENDETVGQQFQTDTGPIDILAISKDKKTLLVVELKKGRASDCVIGQVQRYMGYVKEELAEVGQSVHGAIIALEDDERIQRALTVTTNIEFYTYEVKFKLEKKHGLRK